MSKLRPDLKQHCFKTDRPEPCTAKLALWVPKSMLTAIKERPDSNEWVRKALQKALDAENPLESPQS